MQSEKNLCGYVSIYTVQPLTCNARAQYNESTSCLLSSTAGVFMTGCRRSHSHIHGGSSGSAAAAAAVRLRAMSAEVAAEANMFDNVVEQCDDDDDVMMITRSDGVVAVLRCMAQQRQALFGSVGAAAAEVVTIHAQHRRLTARAEPYKAYHNSASHQTPSEAKVDGL